MHDTYVTDMTGPLTVQAAPAPDNAFEAGIFIPLDQNPLSLNGRYHYHYRAKHTREWREFVAHAAETERWPALGKCLVTLTWYVNTRHRRDEDNLVPLFKAMCDGLVDAGIVLDDTSHYMVKLMPRIRYERGCLPHMVLEVKQLTGTEP